LAVGLQPDPLGELRALPDTLYLNYGCRLRRPPGKESKVQEEKRRRKREEKIMKEKGIKEREGKFFGKFFFCL